MKQYKKYKNRKLYDVAAHDYVTLEEVVTASLEEKVQVLDFTGMDITNATLLDGFMKILDKDSKGELIKLAQKLFIAKGKEQNLTEISKEQDNVTSN